jgi:hypothetical protein
MAQAVKKKLIVCGGNGFLGITYLFRGTDSNADYEHRKPDL